MDNWIDKLDLLIRIPHQHQNEPKYLFHDKIVAFNFDNTLIKPKNNNNYTTFDDWILWDRSVLSKLSELHDKSYSLVVFSNLPDILKNQYSKMEFQKRFDSFCQLLFNKQIPIIGFFSIKKNFCYKPYTGMWKLLELLYIKNGFEIPDKKKCIYIGNLAGRSNSPKTYKYDRKCSDASCIDRAFAYNVSIKFYTPERYFINEKHPRENLWRYQNPILTKEERIRIRDESLNVGIKDPFRHGIRHCFKRLFGNLKQFLVIMVGPPTSSKTTLSNYIVDNTQQDIINMKMQPWVIINPLLFSKSGKNITKKSIQKISEEIIHGNSIIIDNSNHTIDQRKKFINIVQNLNDIGILIIELSVSPEISKQLNYMRVEMSNDFDVMPVNNNTYVKYYKDYQNPSGEEFQNISINRWKIIKYPFILINVKEWWYIFDKY